MPPFPKLTHGRMGGAEGIINIDIRQSGKGLREGCVVLFFFFVKAKILEQNDALIWVLTIAQLQGRCNRALTIPVLQGLFQVIAHRLKLYFAQLYRLVCQVRRGPPAFCAIQNLWMGQRAFDAMVLGDPALFSGTLKSTRRKTVLLVNRGLRLSES